MHRSQELVGIRSSHLRVAEGWGGRWVPDLHPMDVLGIFLLLEDMN